jgi:hypothetical protein
MTTIINAVRNRLGTDADILAILPITRIFPKVLPQNPSFPAIVLNTLDDAAAGDDISGMAGLFRATVQVDSWALTMTAAQPLAEKVRLSLQGYAGVHAGVTIHGIYYEFASDDFEGEVQNWRIIQRYQLWYDRANPIRS